MKRLVFGLLMATLFFLISNNGVLAVAGPTLRPTWIDDDFVTPTPTNTPIPTATPLPTSTPIPTSAPNQCNRCSAYYDNMRTSWVASNCNLAPATGVTVTRTYDTTCGIAPTATRINQCSRCSAANNNEFVWWNLEAGKTCINPPSLTTTIYRAPNLSCVLPNVTLTLTPTRTIGCEWCGDECRDTRIKRTCSNLTPAPKDMDCKPMDGVCTVVGKPRTCLTCQEGVPPRSEGNANVEVNKCDNKIDLIDFGIWKAEYLMFKQGIKAVSGWKADFQCDEKIDLVDFGVWKVGYFKYKDLPLTTPVLTQMVKPTITSAPAAVPTLSGKLTCGARCTLNSQCESNDCRALTQIMGDSTEGNLASTDLTIPKYCYCRVEQ